MKLRPWILALWPLAPLPVSAQEVTIFAPDAVSVPGGSLYRGDFTPDGTSFYFLICASSQ